MDYRLETLCIRITQHCNLACSHCRAGSSPRTKIYNRLGLVKKFLSDARSIGLQHVSLSGGEPGIDGRVGNLTRWLLDRKLRVTITTNGTTSIVTKLRESNVSASPALRLRVSLDGAAEVNDALRGHGSFERALRGMREIKAWSKWVAVNTVVLPGVLDSIGQMYARIGGIGVNEWALIAPVAKGTARDLRLDRQMVQESIARLRERIEGLGFEGRIVVYDFLGTPHTSVLVEPNGSIVLGGAVEGDDVPIGRLDDYDLREIQREIGVRVRGDARTHFLWNEWKD